MSDELLLRRLRIGWHDDDTPIWVSDAMTEAAARIEQLKAQNIRLSGMCYDLNADIQASNELGKALEEDAGQLRAERERLALAICGGEDAPGYANAQTVETLEHVAKQNRQSHWATINSLLAEEAERDEALNQLDSARYSVEVLEQRVAAVMAERDRLREALEHIISDCEVDYPPSHGAIKYAAKLALKGESHD